MKSFNVFWLLASLCVGCSSKQDYFETVKHGMKTVPHAREIKQVFPTNAVDHFISMYGYDRDKPVEWISQVFFDGKYILTYHVDVMVDYKTHEIIKPVTKPEFVLEVVSNITIDPGGGSGARFEDGHIFGEEQWNKIVAAGGDFSAAGIKIKTNSPVPGFHEYVNDARVGRDVVVE